MKKLFADAASLLLITIMSFFFFWRFFFPTPQLLVTPDFGRSDAWNFSFPTKYFLGESLKNNALPLWSSKLGGGFPLFAEGQTGTFFLPNLILYRFLDPIIAYNMSLLLIPITIGWGMYVWLRVIKLSPVAAFFGGATLACSGLIMSQLPHITLLQGFSLLPWVMVATHQLSQKKSWRWIAILACIISQQIFAGFPQASFITILFAGGYAFWLTKRDKSSIMNIVRFGSALILALGLSAVQLLPSLEFLQESTARDGFSPADAAYFSYPPKHLVTMLDPFLLGNPKLGTYPAFSAFDGSIFWENTGFIGIIPLVFVFLSVLSFKKGRLRGVSLFFLISLFLSFLLMLGSHSPMYIIYSFWPFNLFRVPSRFLWVFVVSLIVLASLGIERFWTICTKNPLAKKLLVTGILLHGIFLIKIWTDYHAIQPAKDWLTAPPVIKRLPADATVYTVGSEQTHNRTFLTGGWQDVQPYEGLRNTMSPDSNLLWNISSTQVYAGRFLRRQSLIDTLLGGLLPLEGQTATVSAQAQKFFDIFGVTHVISTVPLTVEGPNPVLEFTDHSATFHVYANTTAVPRVYLAKSITLAQTFEEAVRKINEDSFIPGKDVLLETPMEIADTKEEPTDLSPATVDIIKESNTAMTVSVWHNSGRAILVLNDTFYPGWSAWVDQKETDIFPVNIKGRGIIIDQGDHTVVFRFEPQSVKVGAAISLTTLAIIGAGFLLSAAISRTRQKDP